MFRFDNGFPVLSRVYVYKQGQKVGVLSDGSLFHYGREIPEKEWKSEKIRIRQERIFSGDCLIVYRRVKNTPVLSEATAYYVIEARDDFRAIVTDERGNRKLALYLRVCFHGGKWELTGSKKGFTAKKWIVVNENY